MTTYTTVQGDRLDKICSTYYGSVTEGQVEQVLTANPHLSDDVLVYDEGVKIALPDIAPASTGSNINLWS